MSDVTNLNGHIVFAGQGSDGQALRSLASDDSLLTLSPLQLGPTIGSISTDVKPVHFGNRTYFFATSENGKNGLWRTDGTTAGTVLISDQLDAPYASKLAVNDVGVYLVTRGGTGQMILTRVQDPLDGSPERGVEYVADLPFLDQAIEFVGFGDRLLLSGRDNFFFPQNLISDGTVDGTVPLPTVPAGYSLSAPIVLDNNVYFSVEDFFFSDSLWKSDGTAAGTTPMLVNQAKGWTKVTTDGHSLYWHNFFDGNFWRSDDGLNTQTLIGRADNVLALAAQGGVLYYSTSIDQNRTPVYRTNGSIGEAELLMVNNSRVSFEPISGGMLIGDFGPTGYRQRLAVLGQPLAQPLQAAPAFTPFGSLLEFWGSPESGGIALGPVDFPAYGLELGKLTLPAAITLSQQVIQENKPASVIGNLSVGWSSVSEPITYTLVTGPGADDNGSFSLTSAGQLSGLRAFDADLDSVLSVRVRASTSSGAVIAEQAVLLQVRDLFDSVELIKLSNSSISESAAIGTTIGTFSFQASTGVSASHTLLSVNGATTNLPLSIVGNQLRVARALNYEAVRSLDVVVRTTGSNGAISIDSFRVSVLNVNENAAAPIALSSDIIDENISGAISELSVPGSPLAWTFSLVAGAGDYENSLLSIRGNQLQLSELSDYETRDDYSIRVRAQSGIQTIEAALTISIRPQDEFDPTALQLIYPEGISFSLLLFENVPAGDIAASIAVLDADRGEEYVATGSFFGPSGDALAYAQGSSLVSIFPANYERDFGAGGSVTASFGSKQISLSGGGFSVTILGDRNDPPLPGPALADVDIVAGQSQTYTLPVDAFIEEDFNDSLTLSATLNGNPLPNWLSFIAGTGEFQISPTSTNVGQYNVTVTATDTRGATGTQSFVLTVLSGALINVIGTGGNDAITVSSQNAAGTNWSVTLNGQVVYNGPFTVQTPLQIVGGAGTDQITVLATTGTDSIVLSDSQLTFNGRRMLLSGIESQTINGRGGSDTFSIVNPALVAARAPAPGLSLIGGSGVDTLIAGDSNNQWTITDRGQGTLNSVSFTGFENLIGGSADDQFTFGRRGDLLGQLDGRAGHNSIDLSASTSTTNLNVDDLLPITGTVNGFDIANVDEVRASARSGGTVTGPAAALIGNLPVTWVINQVDAFIDSQVHLFGFDTFVGSTGNDLFYLQPGQNLQTVLGGGGHNTLFFQGEAPSLLVELNENRATGLQRFENISVIDTLISDSEVRGANQNTTWRFRTGVNEATTSQGISLRSFARIVGGSRNDRFEIETYASVPQSISGGGGDDTLATVQAPSSGGADWSLDGPGSGTFFMYSANYNMPFSSIENLAPGTGNDFVYVPFTPNRDWFNSLNAASNSRVEVIYGDFDRTVPLEVNLQNRTANGFRAWMGVAQFTSFLPNAQIVGRNSNVEWQLDLAGVVSDGITAASGFTTLVAGSGNDYFNIFISGEQPGTKYPMNLRAGLGTNWLDYSQLLTLPGNVNLLTGTADHFASIAGFQNVVTSQLGGTLIGNNLDNILIGQAGRDWIYGMGGNDVLMGNGGDDVLSGGSGRDLLIGGVGADLLTGGSDDDLLIADLVPSLFDASLARGLQAAAVSAVMAEWTSNRSYIQRVARLRAGVGAGQSVRLASDTVLSDGRADVLFGEAGDDWFWGSSEDQISDLNPVRERVR